MNLLNQVNPVNTINNIRLRHQRQTVHLEYKQACEISELKGEKFVYANQQEAACETLTHFMNGKNLVMIVAQPGTGKTGTFVEITKTLTTHPDDDFCVEINNIHITSGMNDTDWRDQFQSKMLPSFRENIHHRSILSKQIDNISTIRNGLLAIDECHIASEKNMTISNVLTAAGLTDINVVSERNIRMLDISATPESVAWDLEKWGDKAAIVRLIPGLTYKGFSVMLEENRIRAAPSFTTMENVREWFQFFVSRYQNTTKKYFPIRVANPIALGHIRSAIVEFGWIERQHNSVSRIAKIDDIMRVAPEKHTIILIKEFWRASKRLIRTHVGGSYEEIPKKRNVTSASQSTIGRFCDNFEYEGDELDPDLRPVHFGDEVSIKAYVKWFNEGCDFRKANYSSTRINSRNGHVDAKQSKNHVSNWQNLDAVEVQNGMTRAEELNTVTRNSQEIMRKFIVEGGNDKQKWKEANEFYKSILGKNITGKSKPTLENEFYNCTTTVNKEVQSASNIDALESQGWSSLFQLQSTQLSYARVFVGYVSVDDPTKYTIYIKYVQLNDTEENKAILKKYGKKEKV